MTPATNVTEPTTAALAARTRPRAGAAARVVRIRPRRYSAVMNMAPTTITTISPANAPTKPSSAGMPIFVGPGPAGAMSPEPVTVNVPPAVRNRPGRDEASWACAPMLTPRHPPPGAACGRLTWSKTAVATVRPLFWVCTHAGEVTNGPACTVAGRPARLTAPTLVQCVPSAESYPVSVSPARTSRSQRGDVADTAPGRPGVSPV